MQTNKTHTIVRSAGLVGLLTLLSRLVGLYRDRLFASTFGAGNTLDSYYAAFRMPDIVFNLLVLGTLSVAFIPVFTEYFVKNENEAEKIANTILNVGFVAMSLLCGILYFFVPQLMEHIIAPGFTGQKLADTITLTRIFLLSPIIFTVSSVFGSILNSLKRFLLVSFAPILYNIGIILGIVFLYPHFGIKGLAYGVIFGAVLHLFAQLFGAFASGFKYSFTFDWRNPGVIKIAKLFIPRIIGVDNAQISLLIASIIGSFLSAGAITVFTFANNLQAVPIGIFAVSFAMASFPNLSEAYAREDAQGFNSVFSKTALNIIFFVLPLSVLMIVLRAQIVRVIYGAGRFDWSATRLTANTLGIFALSVIAQSLTPLIARAFYAKHNTIIPVLVGILTLAVNAATSFILVGQYGVLGLAMGFSIAEIFSVITLYLILRGRLPQFNESSLFGPGLKMLVSSLVGGTAAYFSLRIMNVLLPLDHTINVLIQGATAGIAGVAVFMGCAYLFGLEQTDYIFSIVKRRILG